VFDYFLETHRTKLDHKTILAYEETRDVFPGSFLGEPAENVTPAMFRKLISERTRAPVRQNRHLSRLKAAIHFARSESYLDGAKPQSLAVPEGQPMLCEKAQWTAAPPHRLIEPVCT
jgi:hypothetical protein